MTTLKTLILMTIATATGFAHDITIPAIADKNVASFTYVDSIDMVFDGKMELYLRVQGRKCLKIMDDDFCDFLDQDFSLPKGVQGQKIMTPEGKEEFQVSLVTEDNEIYIGFQSDDLVYGGIVELNPNVSLYYDEKGEVPTIGFDWVLLKKGPTKKVFKRMDRFQRLYRHLN
ncbi:hypothetical protein HOF92_10850 [bacterium]|jgi:hypothetical protein|nr:hypothetical protein [bacterium]